MLPSVVSGSRSVASGITPVAFGAFVVLGVVALVVELVLGVMVVIMAMPVATIITMLSAQYDKDQTLAASSVFITTLLSVITIPLLAAVLKAG